MRSLQFISRAVVGVLVGLTLAGCGNAAKPAVPAAPLEHLTIYYTCDMQGHIEPCSCDSGRAGGIARRMTFLANQAARPYLLVDAGDVTFGAREWDIIEMDYVLQGYDGMGYHAVNIGHRELGLPESKLKELSKTYEFFISANLLDTSGDRIFPAYRLVELDTGNRVAVFGVMDENLSGEQVSQGLRVIPAGDALAASIPAVRDKAERIIVLAFGDESFMTGIAERFFEVDVIVGGKVLQPTQEPVPANRSLLVYITDKGKAVGELALAFNENSPPTYRNLIHMLDDDVPDHPAMVPIVDAFLKARAGLPVAPHRDDTEGLSTITAVRSASANRFVDAAACRECHAQAYDVWRASHHALSFQTLVAEKAETNPDCLPCHTVGHGSSDGFISTRVTPALASVGCDACHGRGDHHVRFHRGENVPERAAMLITTGCVTCHDERNSPKFEHDAYWELIRHGNDQ
jgi:2',3'-cyclic-nucleotide 2'-phosphodiesterase (5'-nucleotidase family)